MKFLAAVDLSEASLLSLDALRAFAGDAGGDVTLLHVVDLDLYTAGGAVPGIMEFAKERLQEESERLAGCGLRVSAIRVEQGDSAQTIRRVATEEKVDLVVMTNLGKGARTGRVFGSVAERVASQGTVPVLVERVDLEDSDGGTCRRLASGSPFERTMIAVDVAMTRAPCSRRSMAFPASGRRGSCTLFARLSSSTRPERDSKLSCRLRRQGPQRQRRLSFSAILRPLSWRLRPSGARPRSS